MILLYIIGGLSVVAGGILAMCNRGKNGVFDLDKYYEGEGQ